MFIRYVLTLWFGTAREFSLLDSFFQTPGRSPILNTFTDGPFGRPLFLATETSETVRPVGQSSFRAVPAGACPFSKLNSMAQTVHSPVLLYVEDDPTTSYLFKMAVEELDCRVNLIIVNSSDAASGFLCRRPPFEDAPVPDLVVLDLNLPGRSGFEILQDIRQDEQLARLSVVVFTSSRRKADQEKAEQLGVRAFFHKPRDVDTFWQTVKQICDLFLKASVASSG